MVSSLRSLSCTRPALRSKSRGEAWGGEGGGEGPADLARGDAASQRAAALAATPVTGVCGRLGVCGHLQRDPSSATGVSGSDPALGVLAGDPRAEEQAVEALLPHRLPRASFPTWHGLQVPPSCSERALHIAKASRCPHSSSSRSSRSSSWSVNPDLLRLLLTAGVRSPERACATRNSRLPGRGLGEAVSESACKGVVRAEPKGVAVLQALVSSAPDSVFESSEQSCRTASAADRARLARAQLGEPAGGRTPLLGGSGRLWGLDSAATAPGARRRPGEARIGDFGEGVGCCLAA